MAAAFLDIAGAVILQPGVPMMMSNASGSVRPGNWPADYKHPHAFPKESFNGITYPFAVNLVLIVNMLGNMISNMVMGMLSDKYGRRPLMLLGLFCGLTSLALYYVAGVVLKSFWVYLACWLLQWPIRWQQDGDPSICERPLGKRLSKGPASLTVLLYAWCSWWWLIGWHCLLPCDGRWDLRQPFHCGSHWSHPELPGVLDDRGKGARSPPFWEERWRKRLQETLRRPQCPNMLGASCMSWWWLERQTPLAIRGTLLLATRFSPIAIPREKV